MHDFLRIAAMCMILLIIILWLVPYFEDTYKWLFEDQWRNYERKNTELDQIQKTGTAHADSEVCQQDHLADGRDSPL